MRFPFVLLLLVVAALIGWFAASGETPPAPPPGSTTPVAPGTNEPRSSAPGEGTELPRHAAPTPAPAAPANPAATPAAAPTTPAAAAAANVLLRVRDLTTTAPLPSCRWRFRSAGLDRRGDGPGTGLTLELPAGARGELLLEADGHQPLQRADFAVPGPGENALQLDLFLVPTVATAGITLLVYDTSLQPIPHLRVDAYRITEQNRNLSWWLGPVLWARRTKSPDGRFVLPPLAPGEYGLRVLAVDGDGNLQPFLPWSNTFTVTGDNGYVEHVTLEAGSLPLIELVDLTGNPYDPATHGTATLGLREPGGPAVQRRWVVASGTVLANAIDTLPGIGPCWPAEPLRAGNYVFEVFVNGQPRVQQTLVLRAGEWQPMRIQVP